MALNWKWTSIRVRAVRKLHMINYSQIAAINAEMLTNLTGGDLSCHEYQTTELELQSESLEAA